MKERMNEEMTAKLIDLYNNSWKNLKEIAEILSISKRDLDRELGYLKKEERVDLRDRSTICDDNLCRVILRLRKLGANETTITVTTDTSLSIVKSRLRKMRDAGCEMTPVGKPDNFRESMRMYKRKVPSVIVKEYTGISKEYVDEVYALFDEIYRLRGISRKESEGELSNGEVNKILSRGIESNVSIPVNLGPSEIVAIVISLADSMDNTCRFDKLFFYDSIMSKLESSLPEDYKTTLNHRLSKRRNVLDKSQIDEFIRRYKNGEDAVDLGKEFKIHPETLWRLVEHSKSYDNSDGFTITRLSELDLDKIYQAIDNEESYIDETYKVRSSLMRFIRNKHTDKWISDIMKKYEKK
nr:MAG TPA: hypothetical protein [Caudoviricetes sp.]